MGKAWKIQSLLLGLSCELCNGLPINLENTVADSHTQLLTGLVAILLTVCSVVFLAGCLCCHRRNGFKEFRDSAVVASTASNLDHGHINPVANSEFTIFTPLSPPHQNNNVFLANQQIITRTQDDYTFGDVDVSSWFSGNEKDFPRIRLKYIKEIGKGWFGRVVEGAAQETENGEQKWTSVVVRILEATASSRERVVFLHDASIYRCGKHPNILNLFGRCLDTIPLLLLQEYCPQGDLKNYLRQNKPTLAEYPLIWCCQLSSALKHLHDHKLIHPDLAARNCQLTSNLTLKLGDYGLSVFQYPQDYYQGAPGVSVRWCAPETVSYTSTTIQPKKITKEANIWTFGVTMWEICECGEQPYATLNDDEVVSMVLGSQNVRLNRPKHQVLYTDYIFRLMQLCWTTCESRPAMSQIDLMLSDLLQVYKNTKSSPIQLDSIKDFDKRWDLFKPNTIVKTDNHYLDNTEIDIEEVEIINSKPLSPSLNNLHGSLDNLLADSSDSQMESWLQNVANKTGDMSYVKGLSEAIQDLDNAIALENSMSLEEDPKIEFKLGPINAKHQPPESPNQSDSLTDSLLCTQRASSGSETEEENWKTKIERGAYTEKVRQKSRSVADLMVLTHIDQSESESETPLPSLDYRTIYKNVRYAPKQNLENVSFMFGSEGNLLNVQETFQDELKKLQEERRDSLLFVPENYSQSNSSENLLSEVATPVLNSSYVHDSPSKNILQELNSTSEIKPSNQVFNVFNVTIDPVQVKPSKLDEIINFRDDDIKTKQHEKILPYEVPKLTEIIQTNIELVDYLSKNDSFNPKMLSDDEENDNSEALYDSGVEGDKMESTESLRNIDEKTAEQVFQVPKLVDLIQDNDTLMDYIIAKYETENLAKSDENFDSLEMCPNDQTTTKDPKVIFDLSDSQEEIMPSSLTHSTVFAQSTPFGKHHSLQEFSTVTENNFTSLNLFNLPKDTGNTKLYSLETWDNFLGESLDQNESQDNDLFDSFSSEPQSILFIENHGDIKDESECKEIVQNQTFVTSEKDKTFIKDTEDINGDKASEKCEENNETWESNNGGWFLHPQISDVSGEMTVPAASTKTDSYVGFNNINVDDEIMAAIRTELLTKLPQAQGCSSGVVQDEEEWDSVERNEVFLRYNVYNTPLSPIPEESYIDEHSFNTLIQDPSDDESSSSDWTDQCEREILPHDAESPSGQMNEHHPPLHRHTPSQESCCSNDTLFNLEELTYAVNDVDKESNLSTPKISENDSETIKENNVVKDAALNEVMIQNFNESTDNKNETPHTSYDGTAVNNVEHQVDTDSITLFLNSERDHDYIRTTEPQQEESNSESTTELVFVNKQIAPLPSPEDKPWKQLPASLLTYDTVINQNMLLPTQEAIPAYVNLSTETPNYENVKEHKNPYDNVTNIDDFYNEADYVNIVNIENSKNVTETEDISGEFNQNTLIINNGNDDDDQDIFGVLTDIRFNGPSDSQLMTTSFSESNDLNDEQDWDSGSDTRSSSSGEFIWKEGEHEESLKALRAAPQDVLEDVNPMEGIQEESSSETSGSDEEDGDSPEFVPSAWDKYATPTKSALRSPEKTLEKSDKKKSKGVWFKKQKYHCVYEYPREPDSPVLHSYDLWQPQSNYSNFDDWELDGTEPYPLNDSADDTDFSSNYYKVKPSSNLNVYQLSSLADFSGSESTVDDEFFISSSARPFEMTGGLSSQFFPGNWTDSNKGNENATPDSGVEDITPSDFIVVSNKSVKTLRELASDAIRKSKQEDLRTSSDVLGGLRHTRNKLKLDLPPSPSAFTISKGFTIEPIVDPVMNREKPTFTTFGKSRFLVQHVDTPPEETSTAKNVSFEALPYKPLQKQFMKEDFDAEKHKGKVEVVRGEASLLDSGDEDSGIESSTLERKLSNPF